MTKIKLLSALAALAFFSTTSGQAQEGADLAKAGLTNDARDYAALARPVSHARACDATPEPGFARCHAHLVLNRLGLVFAAATPAGFGPTDLRSAYKITGTGSASTTVAIVDAFG
jgi:hypothetical protein